MTGRFLLFLTVGVVAVASVVGCTRQNSNADASVRFTDQMQERFRGMRMTWLSRGIEELLPGTRYLDETGQEVPDATADLFVKGTISEVAPGAAYEWVEDGDSASPREVAYDSADAVERTVHLSIRVDRVLGGPANDKSIMVVLRIGYAQFDDAVSALTSMGELVLPLGEPAVEPSFYEVPTGAYGILGGGELLAVVKGDGRLSFPFISDAARRRELMRNTGTYQDLLIEAQTSGRVVQVRRDGGDPYRPKE